MGTVAHIDDYRGHWCAEKAACRACGHEWLAVFPASVSQLECGNCGEMHGHPVGSPRMTIDSIGGNCPVQAEGHIDGQPFYFRARGKRWSLSIGGEPVGAPGWSHHEEWPGGPYDAGWMSLEDALRCIARGIELYDAAPPRESGNGG